MNNRRSKGYVENSLYSNYLVVDGVLVLWKFNLMKNSRILSNNLDMGCENYKAG